MIFEEILIKFSIRGEANISDSKEKKGGIQYSLVKNVWGYYVL